METPGLFCAENRTLLELYVGFSEPPSCPTEDLLLGSRRPSTLSHWKRRNRLHIEPIGRVPADYLQPFLRAFVAPFTQAGFRLVGSLARGCVARSRTASGRR